MSGGPDQQGQGPLDRTRPERGPGRHRATPAEWDQPDRYGDPPSHPYPGDTYPGDSYVGNPYADNPYPGDQYPGAPADPDPDLDQPDVPGPMPMISRPDHLTVPGQLPSVTAKPGWFPDQEDDRHAQDDHHADEDDPDDGYGPEPEGEAPSGPIVPTGPGYQRKRRGDGSRRRGGRSRAPLIALLVLVFFVSGTGVIGYHFLRQYVIPPDYSGSGYGSVVVQIKQNQTATDVAQTLFGLGVVASPRAFVKAAEQSSRQTALEPGSYRLHRNMKAALAFDLLLSPAARIQSEVTIPEGLRASQIVATLGARSGIPLKAYRAAFADPAALGLPSYARSQPEGYLFPATYPVQPRTTATGVLRAMVQQFDAEATRINLVGTANAVNLTPAEAITVASLVQAEGGRIADYPKIARVIYNRLAANMPLQLDSTVMYALHAYGILATNQQLQVNSPYNTYKHAGLPPGPIDSPGDAAIHAALHPQTGNWLYFVTVNPKTGLTEFTSSPTRFAQLRAELQQYLGQGG